MNPLNGTRNFAGVIKLSILSWGNYSELSEGFQCSHSVLIRKTQENLRKDKWQCDDGSREREIERCYTDGPEDQMRPSVKEYRQLLEARRGKETDSPLSFQEGGGPVTHFRFLTFRTYYKRLNWYCLKPLSCGNF